MKQGEMDLNGGPEMEGLLSVRAFSKTFHGKKVLDSVDIDVAAGEVHALVGHNGSGKSTLIKCMAGYHAPDPGGRMRVGGKAVRLPLDPKTPRVLGLSFVHQDLGLSTQMTVLENLCLGRFSTGFGWRIKWGENARRVRNALERVNLEHVDPFEPVSSLSEVERAQVAIARALEELEGAQSGILVLDEPTAYLPRDGVSNLFAAIEKVTKYGAGVLFVTHRVEEVTEHADRVTVLRDGHRIATTEVAGLSDRNLVELIVGRPIAELYPSAGRARDDVAMVAERVSGHGVSDFSVRIHRGETVGVTGLLGMGHEAIPYLLFGASPASSGRLGVEETNDEANALRPDHAIQIGLGLLPADRQLRGGVGPASARENVTLTTLDNYVRWGHIDGRREQRAALDLLRRFGVKPDDPEHRFDELSGGNQQKVLLAKWFAADPAVLLLHEPTQGVDIGSRKEVFAFIRAYTNAGGAVLIASSEYEELAHLCDRVLVLRDGLTVAELRGDALTFESIVEQVYLPTDARRTELGREEKER